MNIHEYQAKELLKRYGVPVLRGHLLSSSSVPEINKLEEILEVLQPADSGSSPVWVVKAQIHAGGRGKGGGIKLARSIPEVSAYVKAMLGSTLVTPQTGPQGKVVNRVYVEEGCAIAHELYLSLVVDRGKGRVGIIASTAGGMDIEEVAATSPQQIHRAWIDPATGFQAHYGREIAYSLMQGLIKAHGSSRNALKDAAKTAKQLCKVVADCYQAFVNLDAALLEINPLVITSTGDVMALDAKMAFDDNALYRHPDVAVLRDETEEDPAEQAAHAHDLSYIKLDGSIGCMVNGAGLAMATMDIIKLYGGDAGIYPANFLDVGGGASQQKVTEALKIILSDTNVKGVLVNIFGGIMRCDVIAQGIVGALQEVRLSVPMVVRLEGTNVEEGRRILQDSAIPLQTADTLADAARRVVDAVHAVGAGLDPQKDFLGGGL